VKSTYVILYCLDNDEHRSTFLNLFIESFQAIAMLIGCKYQLRVHDRHGGRQPPPNCELFEFACKYQISTLSMQSTRH